MALSRKSSRTGSSTGLLVLLAFVCILWSSIGTAKVRLAHNQLGYLPKSVKLVRLIADAEQPPQRWQARTGAVEKTGLSSAFEFDAMAQQWVATVDLSAIEREGNVRLEVAGEALEFSLSDSVYDGLLQQLLRSYYLQRCGIELRDQLSQLVHAVCHTEDGRVSVSNEIDKAGQAFAAAGGWHDAGDYGKYVSTTAVTASQLLHLFERYPAVFEGRSYYIPESGNRVPDVLDEVRVGLDWLLTMQRSDGAFYRKLSGKAWPKLVPPDEDVQPRYLFGVATDDSAKAVAALARGARVFADFDKSQSRRYLQAAEQGWRYLLTQPDLFIALHPDDDKGSGPYRLNKIDQDPGLTHHRDDLLAAATQLFLTTSKSAYGAPATELLADAEVALYEWKNPALLSIVELLEHADLDGLSTVAAAVRNRLRERAASAHQRSEDSGFGLANHRIIWGSNKMAAAEGSLLLYADELTKSATMRAAAQAQLDYLLGANPQLQTFVSGVGERPVRHVSHIFARAIGRDIPGLMVGGPNTGAQAGKAPKDRGLQSYIDDAASYATNEYAIDYNAALIGLVVQLKAAHNAGARPSLY